MSTAIQARSAPTHGVGVDASRGLRRVLVFWIPLILFVVITLFPFYWMLLASLKANSELYNLRSFPFWVSTPTADHYLYLFEKTLYARWLMNTLII